MELAIVLLAFLSGRSAGRLISFGLQFVNGDTSVRAYDSTRCTADAGFGTRVVAVGIALVVYLGLCELDGIGRTSHNTEIAALATFGVDNDSSFNFCHYSVC